MNRRSFLKRAPVAAAAVALAPSSALVLDAPRGQYGLVKAGATPQYYLFRCWLDGGEITERCFSANDQEGWADIYTEDWTLKRVYGDVVLRKVS